MSDHNEFDELEDDFGDLLDDSDDDDFGDLLDDSDDDDSDDDDFDDDDFDDDDFDDDDFDDDAFGAGLVFGPAVAVTTGLVSALRGNRRAYARQAARLARLASRGKTSGRRWNRNVRLLQKNWASLSKTGKTTGLIGPKRLLKGLEGGASSPAVRTARRRKQQQPRRRQQQRGRGQQQSRRAPNVIRMRPRRRQQHPGRGQQQPGRGQQQPRAQRRGRRIPPHQQAQVNKAAAQSNYARRRRQASYTPTAAPGGLQARPGGRQVARRGMRRGFGAESDYEMTPKLVPALKAHPLQSLALIGVAFGVGVLLSDRVRDIYS